MNTLTVLVLALTAAILGTGTLLGVYVAAAGVFFTRDPTLLGTGAVIIVASALPLLTAVLCHHGYNRARRLPGNPPRAAAH